VIRLALATNSRAIERPVVEGDARRGTAPVADIHRARKVAGQHPLSPPVSST
jgi:hypothetical protein